MQETLPPPAPQPVKFTVNVTDLGDPRHFEESMALDLAEIVKLIDLGLAIEDLEAETPSPASLAWAAWVWVRREYVPGMSWEDAQERIRLIFG